MNVEQTIRHSAQWDIFIAHSGPDIEIAERLYDLLAANCRVFLDSRSLLLGETWDVSLATAQQRSLVTVVLVSSNTEGAYYQREEVAAAIDLARKNPETHRVVPIYVNTDSEDARIPYGLRLKHGITLSNGTDLADAANRLLNLLKSLSNLSTPVAAMDALGHRPPEQKEISATQSTSTPGWKKHLHKRRREWIGAVVVLAVLALLWLVTRGPAVMRKLYPEAADIAITANRSSISVGQALQVVVKITQTAAAPVSGGVVRIHLDPHSLYFAPHSPEAVNTPAIRGVMTLEKPFVLFASGEKTGTTEIYATLETRSGTYRSRSATIDVSRSDTQDRPYIERGGNHALNLSGEWHIEIDGVLGTMTIRQDRRNNITGTYRLVGASEEPMKVDGFKDGTSFKVFLDRQTGVRRWQVDANFGLNSQDQRFIEMKGCAFLIQRDATVTEDTFELPRSDRSSCTSPRSYVGWKGIKASTFWASAQMQQ